MQNNVDVSLLITLLNGMDDSMYIIDLNGDTVFYNNATLKLYRCSREVFEKHYKNMYYMEEHGTFKRNLFYEVLKKKQPAEGWLLLTDIHGDSSLYYVVDRPIFDSNGNVKYVVGTTKSREKIDREHAAAQSGLHNIIQGALNSGTETTDFIYKSYAMTTFVNSMKRVAPTDVSILLQGETGTGKEVLANYIHVNSNRKDMPMVSINCAAIAPSLFEAEMFGYAKGAFTGSSPKGKIGLIQKANHSTLFLDEIDSMPLDQQGKLLRALETKTIYRLSENEPIAVDFRLIAATNKNMEKTIWEGKFREDLYYRLNVIPAIIPPLRARREDIRPLADYYLTRYCAKYSMQKNFSENVYAQLEAYNWPGNVRELKHLIERTILMSDLETININSINLPNSMKESDMPGDNDPFQLSAAPEDENAMQLDERIEEFERSILQDALAKFGSYSDAAKHLGISISTMSRKAAKYKLVKDSIDA